MQTYETLEALQDYHTHQKMDEYIANTASDYVTARVEALIFAVNLTNIFLYKLTLSFS